MKTAIAILFLITIFFQTQAQEIIQPSKNYKGGEMIFAPSYGLKLEIPSHWNGYLSRGTEIFTVSNDTTLEATALYFVNETSLPSIQSNWEKGFELATELSIELLDTVTEKDGVLSAPIHTTGSNPYKGYLLAKCGEYNYCVTVLMYTPHKFYPPYEGKLKPLIDQLSFYKPRPQTNDFDWKKALTNKMIFNSARGENGSKEENRIWLYYDGTFKSKTQRTGVFRGQAGKYHGTKKGSYIIQNAKNENPATLELQFKKQPSLTLTLTIKDNQYYLNSDVIYFSEIK
ncbi:hypothetical protein N6H18_05690 [Reichenbachiella agarivorans]|uniref:Uncharacterized protein n=1 Tax=Reichenbachiella agarivorans TaxID=2979464 RepID=A0ABY6CVE7_9BACT|nr:hypothetical protein [Reichenbachiella agarivorans]UXP33443.1 hypothetical protein N6H18_05690 [Reichenbachiella agarivorans]